MYSSVHRMTGANLREKRLRFGLSQAELADMLYTSRSAVMAMEASPDPLSPAVMTAFNHLVERRWWQRPNQGPVTLVYSDRPMSLGEGNYRLPIMQCEPFPTNAEAVARVCELFRRGTDERGNGFFNPFVSAEAGRRVVFGWGELEQAYERHRRGKPILPTAWPPKNGDDWL